MVDRMSLYEQGQKPKTNGHTPGFKYRVRNPGSVIARLAQSYRYGLDEPSLEPIEQPQPEPEPEPEQPTPGLIPGLIQEGLVTLLLHNKEHGAKVRSQVPVKLYDGIYRSFAQKAVAFWDKYGEPPGEHVIDLCAELERDDPKRAELIRRVFDSIQQCKNGINPQYVLDKAADFIQEQVLRSGIVEGIGLLEQGNLSGAVAALHKAMDGRGTDYGVDFKPMTLADLNAADLSVEYLIDNMLVAKQPMLMVGPMKSLKTSVMLDLCLSLATGKYFLGQFNVARKIKVVVISGESGKPALLDTLRRIAKSRRIDPAKVANLLVSDTLPQLSNPTHLMALRQLIAATEPELLAIDPAYLALDGTDAANLMIFGQQIRAVSQLCQEMGVALLLCHHSKKASGADYQPIGLSDAAWAGFGEHCRQWFLINHREKWDSDTGTARLWLGVGGSAGHGGLYAVDIEEGLRSDPGGRRWVVTVDSATEAIDKAADRKQDQRLSEDQRKVVRAMTALEKDNPEGSSKTAIAGKANFKGGRLQAALNALVDEGRAETCQIKWGAHNKLHTGFRLTNNE